MTHGGSITYENDNYDYIHTISDRLLNHLIEISEPCPYDDDFDLNARTIFNVIIGRSNMAEEVCDKSGTLYDQDLLKELQGENMVINVAGDKCSVDILFKKLHIIIVSVDSVCFNYNSYERKVVHRLFANKEKVDPKYLKPIYLHHDQYHNNYNIDIFGRNESILSLNDIKISSNTIDDIYNFINETKKEVIIANENKDTYLFKIIDDSIKITLMPNNEQYYINYHFDYPGKLDLLEIFNQMISTIEYVIKDRNTLYNNKERREICKFHHINPSPLFIESDSTISFIDENYQVITDTIKLNLDKHQKDQLIKSIKDLIIKN